MEGLRIGNAWRLVDTLDLPCLKSVVKALTAGIAETTSRMRSFKVKTDSVMVDLVAGNREESASIQMKYLHYEYNNRIGTKWIVILCRVL
jgi:hypothetical protein